MQNEKKPLSARLQELDIPEIIRQDLNTAIAFLQTIKEDHVVMDYLEKYYQDKKEAAIKRALEREKQLALEEIQEAIENKEAGR